MISKIEKRDLPDNPNERRPHVTEDIYNFLESGWDCAEISADGYKDIASAYCSYNNMTRRLGLREEIKVTLRNGRAFMIRVDK